MKKYNSQDSLSFQTISQESKDEGICTSQNMNSARLHIENEYTMPKIHK